MSESSFRDLLFPKKNGGDRDARLARLRRELDDPEVRQALADYLAGREQQARQAADNPEQAWEQGQHGEADAVAGDELLELSTALAVSLGAKQPRAIPMPVQSWIPAVAGLIVGAVGVWFILMQFPTVFGVVNTRPVRFATFEAAIDEMIVETQADPTASAQLGKLLLQQQQSIQTGSLGVNPELTQRFYQLMTAFDPDANQIKQALARLQAAQPQSSREGTMVPGTLDSTAPTAGAAAPE